MSEPKSPINEIPSRIKYYLLEWKDKNIETYMRLYGDAKLHQLDKSQICTLFNLAVQQDTVLINNYKNSHQIEQS